MPTLTTRGLFSRLLRGFQKDKTVIMIAHRLSTVTNADRIYVLSEGRIAESGKHEELIEQGRIYSRMWNEYNRSVSWQVRKAGV